MTQGSSRQNDSLPLAILERIHKVCRDFEAAWQAGDPPEIEDFLDIGSPHADPAYLRPLLQELVKLDLEYRWQRARDEPLEEPRSMPQADAGSDQRPPHPPSACPPRLEDYVARYPELGPLERLPNDLIVHEYRVRTRWGDQPNRKEYLRRFGEHHPRLLDELRAEEERLSVRDAEHGAPSRDDVASTAEFSKVGLDTPRADDVPPEDFPKRIGRYRVEGVLGAGSYGRVYLAHDDDLNRPVAIKVPHRRRVTSREQVERYLTEARVVASLDHPGIVPVYDVGRTRDGLCYVVSKLVEGSDLAARIGADRPSYAESAELVAAVAEALHDAHLQGVVHQDVKPANILVDSAGKPFVVDFGLAIKEEDFGGQTVIAGTPAYMSPEQARGEGHLIDGRSDVFSLGVVLYELLTGVRPFQGSDVWELMESIKTKEPVSPREIAANVPRELNHICLKALSKRVSDRYATAMQVAEDLRHWIAARASARGAAASRSPAESVPVVPKGLRSFDENDADFFLRLLPGPYDRDGLPETLRFWKTRVEASDPDTAFRVGMVYGPSGSGKSSLIKAGLLPLLGEEVVVVHVEATADDLETRILRKLLAKIPRATGDAGLAGCLAQLRRGRGLSPQAKLLLVLDQFEQWLHARHDFADTELVAALRQCDGRRVQCIVMVRDDFWTAATRFMRDLEILVAERQNSLGVDVFDPVHARSVLLEFGRAYGCLPQDSEALTKEQSQFLDRATNELAQDGRVIPVRLSLFAEMVKGRPWIPSTLKGVGGAEGIGLTFLEQTFGAAHSPPEHRVHQRAIRLVLSSLLPEPGNDLKGSMRSREELIEAAGYAHRPRDFDAVLRILNDLRLITPADPEGSSQGETETQPPAPEGQKYYQLTHDYLVSPLRDWLNRKRRETRRGRAELILEERTRQWGASRQDRALPSLLECLRIVLYTRRRRRSKGQREMLRRAFAVHGRRLAFGAVLIACLTSALVLLTPRAPGQFELLQTFADPAASSPARCRAFDRLEVNDVHMFPRVLEAVERIEDPGVVRHATARLLELARKEPGTPNLRADRSVRDDVVELLLALLSHPVDEVECDAFRSYARLAPPGDVVETIRLRAGQVNQALTRAMAEYLSDLALSRLPADVRVEVVRDLALLIRDDRNRALVAASVAQLDRAPPQQLLSWLFEASDPATIGSAAKDMLVPYATRARQERVRRIGRYAEERLKDLVPRSGGPIATTSELAFVLQAAGQIAKLAEIEFPDGLAAAAYMLEHRDLLQTQEILETVIETFVILNRARSVPLDSLRELAGDVGGSLSTREAATRALGELRDLESLDRLQDLVIHGDADLDPWHTLQRAAIESLGKLGSSLKERHPRPSELDEIKATLRQVLSHAEQQPVVPVREALTWLGQLGGPDDVDVFLPLILKRDFNLAATVAVLDVLQETPERAGDVIGAYLTWRTAVADVPPLDHRPDKALIGYSLFPEPTERLQHAAKAVAAGLAEAQAQREDRAARIHAGSLLRQLVRETDFPRIDPDADVETRTRQLRQWREWWHKVHGELKLNADHLERPADRT